MSKAYTAFAEVYDRMMHDVDREAWVAYLDGFLKEAGAREVLDCACGTGATAIRLFHLGYRVIGNDVSPEMLMQARNNAFAARAKQIIFICEDMRKLKIHRPLDALVCVCDGVNYLTDPDDVDSFFAHAAGALHPNGVLLFDVSSPYKFENVLGGNTFTEEAEEYAYIWRNNYDPKSKLCEMTLTGFVKNGAQYDRFTETHLQRAHSVEELIDALNRAGFTDIQVFGAFTRKDPRPDSERLQFVARKGNRNEA